MIKDSNEYQLRLAAVLRRLSERADRQGDKAKGTEFARRCYIVSTKALRRNQLLVELERVNQVLNRSIRTER